MKTLNALYSGLFFFFFFINIPEDNLGYGMYVDPIIINKVKGLCVFDIEHHALDKSVVVYIIKLIGDITIII